jgi:hypothetical protein
MNAEKGIKGIRDEGEGRNFALRLSPFGDLIFAMLNLIFDMSAVCSV